MLTFGALTLAIIGLVVVVSLLRRWRRRADDAASQVLIENARARAAARSRTTPPTLSPAAVLPAAPAPTDSAPSAPAWHVSAEQIIGAVRASRKGHGSLSSPPRRRTTGLDANASLDRDAGDDWSPAGLDPYTDGHPLGVGLSIIYNDREGQRTQRDIDLERYAHDGRDGVLVCFCRLRKARRSFRISRIRKAIDRETGEVIAHLPAWLDARYRTTADGIASDFIDRHTDALTALFFISKADGALRAGERHVLSEFCVACGMSDAAARDVVLTQIATWAAPSRIAYGRSLRGLATRPPHYRAHVWTAAQALIATDKTARDSETRALERMRKEMRPPQPE